MAHSIDSQLCNMRIGYARTSTLEQMAGLESQIKQLEHASCEKIFHEQISSQSIRPKLDAALDYVREGDVFIVTKIDRLARSMQDLMRIIAHLDKKNVPIHILDLHLDTQTPMGKLMLNLLGSIAQFEREVMLERQREGIAKAKADDKYRGRKPISAQQEQNIIALAAENKHTKAVIANTLKIGEATVYRVLARAKKQHDMSG